MWITDNYGYALINLNHIRSIEVKDEEVIAIFGEMKEGEDDEEGEPIYERFLLYEGSEEGDAVSYLNKLSKKLKVID